MKLNKLIFYYLILLSVFFYTGNSFSQIVLDSVVVTGEKYKSFDEKIREKARSDISNGKVILYSHGWPVGYKIDNIGLLNLTHQYGFEYESRGDIVSHIDIIYENEVMLYLNNKNGEGWWERFKEEQSKLITPLTWPKEN